MSHAPRKRFGQNFLRDDGVIEAIAGAIAPDKSHHLVEIGPGEGAITQALVASGCRFDAIELDRDLRTRLLASFSTYDTLPCTAQTPYSLISHRSSKMANHSASSATCPTTFPLLCCSSYSITAH